MRDFSFYDQTGLVIPGTVLLFGVIVLFPDLRVYFDKDGITIGGLGLFLLLAYAAGHGIGAVGNLLENVWWWFRGGMPSDWVLSKPSKLLSPKQIELLPERIHQNLGLTVRKLEMTRKEWKPIF